MPRDKRNNMEGDSSMKLTQFEVANILDALEEWFVNVVPKELSEKDIGLDDYRYSMIHRKLTTFLEQKEEKKI
jgi:hypothetical protein